MSRIELFTAIVVGIGMVVLFEDFHLIPPSYMKGRMAAKAIAAVSFLTVISIWQLIARKKDDSDSN